MTLEQASRISGFAVKTLRDKARRSEFFATKPRGNRGGWEVTETELERFLKRNRIKRGNAAVQEAHGRGIAISI